MINGLVPFVHVRSVERSIAFYETLGFAVNDTFEPDGTVAWAFLEREQARIMLTLADAPIDAGAQAVVFWLYAPDLEGFHGHLTEAGVGPGPIVDGAPGPPREFRLEDPDGYVLMVSRGDET